MSALELDGKVRDYFSLLEEIEALNEQIEAIKDELKGVMVERSTEELDGHGWRATWHNVSSTRFDAKAFKLANPSMYAAFSTKTTAVRFTLNRIKGKAAI